MRLATVPCLLCESGDHRVEFRKFDLPVSRCRECGLVFANPRLPQEEIRKRYNADYFWGEYLPSLGYSGRYDPASFDSRYRPYLELLSEALGHGTGALLEIGAGAGFILKTAERAGWSVIGTELSTEAVDFGRRELGLDIRQVDVERRLDFRDDQFDAVFAFEVIEHLLDPRAAMREVRRVLRPEGVLMMSTPNHRALSRLMLGRGWHVIAPAEHVSYFTETTLRDLLRRTGFTNVRFSHRFAAFGVEGTMNPRATHDPHALRARAYVRLVERLGRAGLPWVQRLGRGDTLLCVAR